MAVERHVPSPYEQLLHALGDSEQSRALINRYARSLAVIVRCQGEERMYPEVLANWIDPFMHTRDTWANINRCPQLASPDPLPSPDQRVTVAYFAQTEQPDGTWESSSGAEADAFWGVEKLRKLRNRFPDMTHQLVARTTTVTVQPVTEPQESR